MPPFKDQRDSMAFHESMCSGLRRLVAVCAVALVVLVVVAMQ